jgi:hypothetical protein
MLQLVTKVPPFAAPWSGAELLLGVLVAAAVGVVLVAGARLMLARARPPAGRPPNRRGRGGVGPGPAYRPSSTGGGTSHRSSFAAAPSPVVVFFSVLFVGLPAVVTSGLVWFVLHGRGVL